MSAEKMKVLELFGNTVNGKPVFLKPVVMTCVKTRWDMWVLDGTALRGWNSVFMVDQDADLLVEEGLLYSDDGEGDVAEEPYKSADELPVFFDADGNKLFSGLICFEGGDFTYLNPDDDPEKEN
jgi:hypothetical protein